MHLKEKELFVFIVIIVIIAAFLSRQSNRISLPVIIGSAIGGIIAVISYDGFIKEWLFEEDAPV
jgi:Kef-type K+ transport system membrane component KefB